MITKQIRNMEVGNKLEFELKDKMAISQAIYRLHRGSEVYTSRVIKDKVIVMRIR